MSDLYINYPVRNGPYGIGRGINLSGIPYPIVPYLINLSPGASVAYSTRRLSSLYTGPALRVRRSSDNAEMDIGFDAFYNLNSSALTTFVGVNSAFIVRWYDQSGNLRHATQPTNALQPFIVVSGVPTTVNGIIAPFFNGNGSSNSSFLSIAPVDAVFSLNDSLVVGNRTNTGAIPVFWGGFFNPGSGSNNQNLGWLNATNELQLNSSGNYGVDNVSVDGVPVTGPSGPQSDTALHQFTVNENTPRDSSIWQGGGGVGIGTANPSFTNLVGHIGEILIYPFDMGSMLRAQASANQKAYWSTP